MLTIPNTLSPAVSPALERVDPRLRWDRTYNASAVVIPPEKDASKDAKGTMNNTNLSSVELFAGAGGLALGVQKAGFSSLATLEWNRWACDTMRENKAEGHALVNDWNIHQGDVRSFNWGPLKDKVDLVSGGPPCQPFSAGGRGKSVDDQRDMFPATAEIISQLQPKAFLIENVRGLTRPAFQEYYEYVLRRLQTPKISVRPNETWFEHLSRLRKIKVGDTLNYEVTPTLVDAADYGIPQHRHRVFMVGFRSDLKIDWDFPKPTHSREELLRDQWITGNYWDRYEIPTSERPDTPSKLVLDRIDGHPVQKKPWSTLRDALTGLPDPTMSKNSSHRNHDFQPGARSYKGHTGSTLDAPAKTLKAGAHGVPGGENMIKFHDGTVRYLTIRESARVQTFPDDYELHGAWGEAMRQLGNAVPVELAEVVAQHVYEKLDTSSTF